MTTWTFSWSKPQLTQAWSQVGHRYHLSSPHANAIFCLALQDPQTIYQQLTNHINHTCNDSLRTVAGIAGQGAEGCQFNGYGFFTEAALASGSPDAINSVRCAHCHHYDWLLMAPAYWFMPLQSGSIVLFGNKVFQGVVAVMQAAMRNSLSFKRELLTQRAVLVSIFKYTASLVNGSLIYF
jgi:hypothetical protein